MSQTNPVVAAETEVTARWLQDVLPGSIAGEGIRTVEFERIGAEYGLASHIFRCRWPSSGTMRSVVLKLWSTAGKSGTREVLFYREFGPAAGPRIPACYHAALDADRERAVLLLEDLGTVLQGDCLRKLPLEQACSVAGALAHLHATWLNHPRLRQATWLPNVAQWERDASWFEPRRTLLLERFGRRIDGLGRALLRQIEQAPAMANRRIREAPLALLHGDLHLDNIVFELDAGPVILDWARCAKGPITLDLAELLFEISFLEDFDQVLATYLHTFLLQGGPSLDVSTVQYQLGGALLRKFATSTCGVAYWQPASPREVAIIDTSIDRALRAVEFWSNRDPSLFAFL